MTLTHLLIALATAFGVATGAEAQIKLPSQPAQQPSQQQPQRPASPTTGGTTTRITVEQFADTLKSAGYRAEIVKRDSGRPYIRTGLSGRRVQVYSYDCEGDACGSFQYQLVFSKADKFNMKYANEWNKQKRYAKAYLDSDNDLIFEWDVDLLGGVGPDFVKQTALSFERYVGIFDSFSP